MFQGESHRIMVTMGTSVSGLTTCFGIRNPVHIFLGCVSVSVCFLALQSREPFPLLWVLHFIQHERHGRRRFKCLHYDWPGGSGKQTNTCRFCTKIIFCFFKFFGWFVFIFVHCRLCLHCIVACHNASKKEPVDLHENRYIDHPSMILILLLNLEIWISILVNYT